jgi:hypothetical protein
VLHTKGLKRAVEACRWGRLIKLKTGEAGIRSLRKPQMPFALGSAKVAPLTGRGIG